MAELKKRLEFIITLALFFPVVLDAIYKATPDESKSGSIILLWGIVIAVLILNYLFVELRKGKMLDWVIKYADRLLVLEVVTFIPVLFVLAATQRELVSFPYVLSLVIGTISIIFIPVGVLVLFVIDFILSVVKEITRK